MKTIATLMIAIIAFSGAVLANPVYEARGNEASNALYTDRCSIGGGDCDDTDELVRPGAVELIRQTWIDPDDDGDGLPTLESTETLRSNKGQVVAAVKKKGKFKAGAELSKSINSAHVGDLDGDGLPDLLLDIRKEVQEKKNRVSLTGAFPKDWTLPPMEVMSKPELVEAIASESGLSKADAKRALDTLVKTQSRR